ncbi:TPA: radical SAM protein [Vibrio vulnificus]|uniref:coproporphyrinogen-III oxidase family protein n=1 Tax=Vibrio navarrensis TaxID=29495 RepID=UPI0018DB5D07|nr:coproporphyrinogen-III oxidase family protein [Vibrio navarrensis]EHA1126399.1 coproporphyrinogen III oxidase family protein [Vibrio navarrensis]MBH9739967.1 radical SAM protein [Vibrio navarrensis]HAS6100763.1 radical SAM protein [Vibrio vulnificus]
MFNSVADVKRRWDTTEIVQYEERDPCYTWLYPLDLGDFDVRGIWGESPVPRFNNRLTLYFHIPFCKFICKMCPFTHTPARRKVIERYVDALCKEIEFYGTTLPGLEEKQVSTIYFGGGTASTLTPEQMTRILSVVRRHYTLMDDCQLTLECHPRTVDKNYLKQMRDIGINRVSFGIQSFNQQYIDQLHLHQKIEQSRQIITDAKALGFDSVGIDLMYRYAGQDVECLEAELDQVFELGVDTLSAYALDAEVRSLDSIAERQKSIEHEREMFYYINQKLEDAGYQHVAQPDYGKAGKINRQIVDLWGAPQVENLSFGAGAFSEAYNGHTWANIHDPDKYIEFIEQDQLPIVFGQKHNIDDAMSRYPALGVRCLSFSFEAFDQVFGVEFEAVFQHELARLIAKGWIEIAGKTLRVTREGKFYIDNISKTFFNTRNRGKTQIWAVQVENLLPDNVFKFKDVL